MKREDLARLGITPENLEKADLDKSVIDEIMKLHGLGVASHKDKLSDAEETIANLTTQLNDANEKIEGFKDMKTPEDVESAVNEWKTKYDQAVADHAEKLVQMDYDRVLEKTLTDAGAINIKAVRALLDQDKIKFDPKDKSIAGIEQEIARLKESDENQFRSDENDEPRFTRKGEPKTVITDTVMDIARKSAGLSPVGENGKK